MSVNRLRALIFDVDGTLADTESDGHRVAFNLAFEQMGLDWNWSVALYGELLSVTGGKERIGFYLDHYWDKQSSKFVRPDNLTEFIVALHQSKTRFYTELMSHGQIPLRPGVNRLLNEARQQGIRLAIATTTTPKNVTVLLTQTLGVQSLEWFEVIAAGDIVDNKKPAADIYDYVLHQMQLSAADCLAFEDSENGLVSANAANLATIVTINDYTRRHDFSGASLVLDHLGEPNMKCNRLSGPEFGSHYLDLAGCRSVFDSVTPR